MKPPSTIGIPIGIMMMIAGCGVTADNLGAGILIGMVGLLIALRTDRKRRQYPHEAMLAEMRKLNERKAHD